MTLSLLDYGIVAAFLVITLWIGLRAGRGINTMREYALANKEFGVGALTLTYLATSIGAFNVLTSAGLVFSQGIIVTVSIAGLMFGLLFRAFFVAPKVIRFRSALTMGDVMETLYGSYSKMLTGVLGSLYSGCIIAMSLLALRRVLGLLVGSSYLTGLLLLSSLLLALYTAHGGIVSVTKTDVFHFLVLIVVIPLMARLAVLHVGGTKALFLQVPRERLLLVGHPKFSHYLTFFLMHSLFVLGITIPPLFQRLLMAQHGYQLRKQYLLVASFHPAFILVIMLLGLAALVMYPNISPAQVVPHLIRDFMPWQLKGVAIAGMLAVVMSTIDSHLHAASLMLVHDCIAPLTKGIGHALDELRWTRAMTLLIAGLATVVAKCTGPLLMFPLVAGILGLKPERKAFYVASAVTVLTFAVSRLWLPEAHTHLVTPISVLANIVTFLLVHVGINGRLVMVETAENEQS